MKFTAPSRHGSGELPPRRLRANEIERSTILAGKMNQGKSENRCRSSVMELQCQAPTHFLRDCQPFGSRGSSRVVTSRRGRELASEGGERIKTNAEGTRGITSARKKSNDERVKENRRRTRIGKPAYRTGRGCGMFAK